MDHDVYGIVGKHFHKLYGGRVPLAVPSFAILEPDVGRRTETRGAAPLRILGVHCRSVTGSRLWAAGGGDGARKYGHAAPKLSAAAATPRPYPLSTVVDFRLNPGAHRGQQRLHPRVRAPNSFTAA